MSKSRSLHWQEPATAPCPGCNGTGEWSGMFSSGPCAACDGTGLVGDDGEPLDQTDLLAIMRRQRDRQHDRLRRLWGTPGVPEAVERHRQRRERDQRDEHAALKKQLRGA